MSCTMGAGGHRKTNGVYLRSSCCLMNVFNKSESYRDREGGVRGVQGWGGAWGGGWGAKSVSGPTPRHMEPVTAQPPLSPPPPLLFLWIISQLPKLGHHHCFLGLHLSSSPFKATQCLWVSDAFEKDTMEVRAERKGAGALVQVFQCRQLPSVFLLYCLRKK